MTQQVTYKEATSIGILFLLLCALVVGGIAGYFYGGYVERQNNPVNKAKEVMESLQKSLK